MKSRSCRCPVVHAHDDAGNVRDPRQLRRPEAALSRDQFIAVSAAADGQRLQDSVLPDGIGQLVQRLRAENFPGLRRIGADGTSREKDHPSGLHVGFQLLTLHCPSSLKESLNQSTRADSEGFCRQEKDGKRRNTECISRFSACGMEAKDPLLSRRRSAQRSLEICDHCTVRENGNTSENGAAFRGNARQIFLYYPVHKIFTEYCIFPLAFFANLRYYISTHDE